MQFPGMEGTTSAPQGSVTGAGLPRRRRAVEAPQTASQDALDANRARITKEGSARPGDNWDTTPVEDYGLRRATPFQTASAMPLTPVAHTYVGDTTRQFSAFGKTKFVNLVGENAVGAGQANVNPERVDQLRRNPDAGRDPRFPKDHAANLPNVLEVAQARDRSGSTAQVLMQGTHRTAAAIANGQMFMEARVIDRHSRVDAVADRQARNADDLWVQRAQFKQDTAEDRQRYRTPTLRGPIGT